MYFSVARDHQLSLAVVHARAGRRDRDRHPRRRRRLPRAAAVPRRRRSRDGRDRADRPAREYVPGLATGRRRERRTVPRHGARSAASGRGPSASSSARGRRSSGSTSATNTRRLRQILEPDELDRATLVTGDITDLGRSSRSIDEHGITNVVHLAALQVPFSRADPPRGAAVNVVGTVNVFEAVRKAGLTGVPLVYASSMGMFVRIGRRPGLRAAWRRTPRRTRPTTTASTRSRTRAMPASTGRTPASPASASGR